jgi:hypothetical protein
MEEIAVQQQKEHTEPYTFGGMIESYLDVLLPVNWSTLSIPERRAFLDDGSDEDFLPTGVRLRNTVCVAEIWCEGIGGKRMDLNRYNSREINLFMRGMKGWKYVDSPKGFGIYGKQKYFKRIRSN